MNDVKSQLKIFITRCLNFPHQQFYKTEWLHDTQMRVYVRKSQRLLPNEAKLIKTLDIASVEIYPQWRRKHIFTNFLDYAYENNPWDAVYIESVFNPFLMSILEKRGYHIIGLNNYYRLANEVVNHGS